MHLPHEEIPGLTAESTGVVFPHFTLNSGSMIHIQFEPHLIIAGYIYWLIMTLSQLSPISQYGRQALVECCSLRSASQIISKPAPKHRKNTTGFPIPIFQHPKHSARIPHCFIAFIAATLRRARHFRAAM